MQEINIAGRKIDIKYRPYVIAEISGNHNQSLERALEIVEAAAKARVHALKIQTYAANKMTSGIEELEFLSVIQIIYGRTVGV